MERELEFEKPLLEIESALAELRALGEGAGDPARDRIAELEERRRTVLSEIYDTLSAWQTVQVARHPQRPVFRDYVAGMCTEFVELHGDRCFGDDAAMQGGFATIGDAKVMLIGTSKGRSVDENVERNFGMAHPEGYRKALRLMRLAEKYGLPVVTLVDTPAAYPGLDAEERGQHEAIARNLTEMARLEVPIVAVVTGEGGSGGALGIGVGDAVLMLQFAIYSVIPPEGCAAILWRDASFAPQAAEAMKITSRPLLELGIIDAIIPEPVGGAHRDPHETTDRVRSAVLQRLDAFASCTIDELLARRFERLSAMGKFNE